MDHIKILEGKTRACIKKYSMINDGDRVCVAVSGGADSLMLLYLLSRLQKYLPTKFALSCAYVDMGFGNTDTGACRAFCHSLGLEYSVIELDGAETIKNHDDPCLICSRTRRRLLCEHARTHGANVLALGHNEDDAAQTLLMNLLYGGNFISFSPVTDYTDIRIIRPLLSCSELLIRKGAAQINAPVAKNGCPFDKNTHREDMKRIIHGIDADCRGTAHRLVHSLEKHNIDGYKE